MKKILALLLAAIMLLGMLAGCGSDSTEPDGDANANRFTFPTLKPPTIRDPDEIESTEETTEPELDPIELPQLGMVRYEDTLSHRDMKYVMIYNPSIILKSLDYIPSRSTGSFGNQINPYMNRADDLDDGTLEVTPDQLHLPITEEQPNKDGDRAGFAPVYRVGNTRNFYCYTQYSLNDPRIVRNFNCRYAGEHCYIWVYNGIINDATAQKYGKEFDENIYEQEVEMFGEPRFADQGGKIHLLYYPMQDEYAGCFCTYDLYASYEFSAEVVKQYGLNTDHAAIHMNGTHAAKPNAQLGMTTTMAHEFQHLICGSDMFYTADWLWAPSWINEAMSTYIETVLYPEYAESQQNYVRLHNDYLIRHGQSLYNFNNITPDNKYDFSTYDSVYLFANYLARLAGDDVFSNFHDYWRYSNSDTLDDVEAIANSVPEAVYQQVMDSVDYQYLYMDGEPEGFISKLTLQFYLDLLDKDETDPAAFSTLEPTKLLYDEINPTKIENGGRVIIALRGNSYTIPKDASSGLMYIGLDENFQPVTDILYD